MRSAGMRPANWRRPPTAWHVGFRDLSEAARASRAQGLAHNVRGEREQEAGPRDAGMRPFMSRSRTPG